LIKNKILENQNLSLVGVFDGHGPQGQFISAFLKLFFAEYFSRTELYRHENRLLLPVVNNAFKGCFVDARFIDYIMDSSNAGNINSSIYKSNINFETILTKEINSNLNIYHEISLVQNNSPINTFSSTNNTNNSSIQVNSSNKDNLNISVHKNYLKKNTLTNPNIIPNNIIINTNNANNFTKNNSNKNTKNKNINTVNSKNFIDITNNNTNPKNIFNQKLSEDNFSVIKTSFALAESTISLSKFDANFSGSTSICIFILENRIICANCGDSRALLVTCDPSNKSLNNIVSLSTDHKPDVETEKNRILGCNGRIDKRSVNGIKTGPLRIWLKNEAYPGLAMTRSIGDLVASKVGVTCEPELFEWEINNDCKFIVVATDGVWEVLSNEEVVGIISPYYNNMDVESATEKLNDEARKKWKNVNYFLKKF